MNWIVLLSSLLMFLSACEDSEGDAVPVNQKEVERLSLEMCPAEKQLEVFETDLSIGREALPNPILFAVEKGPYRCASLHDTNHGGSSWLEVRSNMECVQNGSLWNLASFHIVDGLHVYIDLKSTADPNIMLHIYTSYEYSLSSLRDKIGSITYACADK